MAQTLIETLSLAGSTTVTSAPIGTSYRHLLLVGSIRSNLAATASGSLIRFNSDSGSNYQFQRLRANNTTAVATADLTQTALYFDCPANTAPSGAATAITLDIPAYDETNFNKQVLLSNFYRTGSAATNQFFYQVGGIWNSTAAISTITFVENGASTFANGSFIDIYGLD